MGVKYRQLVLPRKILVYSNNVAKVSSKVSRFLVDTLDNIIRKYKLPCRSAIIRRFIEVLTRIYIERRDTIIDIKAVSVCLEYTSKNHRSVRVCRKIYSR